jgi:hypothetical protein
VAGTCEHDSEPSEFIKGEHFIGLAERLLAS